MSLNIINKSHWPTKHFFGNDAKDIIANFKQFHGAEFEYYSHCIQLGLVYLIQMMGKNKKVIYFSNLSKKRKRKNYANANHIKIQQRYE